MAPSILSIRLENQVEYVQNCLGCFKVCNGPQRQFRDKPRYHRADMEHEVLRKPAFILFQDVQYAR
jgi:hypothetical protein